MSYPHRAFIFVDITKLVSANSKAKAWDPDTGGDKTFGDVHLSATGEEPATHSACNTAITDDMKTKVLSAQDQVPFIAVYWEDDGHSWGSALADEGLQIIAPAP